MNTAKMKLFKEKDIILNEKEIYRSIFKIVKGKVALYINYGTAEEYLLCILSESKYFGVSELLQNNAINYTVVALTDVLIMEIKDSEFEDFISNNAANAIDIMKDLSRQIRMLNKHIELLSNDIGNIIVSNKSSEAQIIDIREKLMEYNYHHVNYANTFSKFV